jgi:hypothetical protein
MLTIHKNRGVALVALLTLALNSTAMADGPLTTVSVDPPSGSQALALYFARAANGDPWSEPNSVSMEIDASLPELAKRGHLRAIRAWTGHRTPDYQAIHIEGDAMVKQQIIARYLDAEKRAVEIPASSVAIAPSNYKFRYIATSGGTPVHAFQITPRKKRSGLIKGELWIDGATGIAVHEAGFLVKRPSIFIRRLKITRDVSLRDGTPYLRTTHLDIDTLLVGRAEMTIVERICTDPPSAHSPSNVVRRQGGTNDACTCAIAQ